MKMWSFKFDRSKASALNLPLVKASKKCGQGPPSSKLATFLWVENMAVLKLTATVGHRTMGPM